MRSNRPPTPADLEQLERQRLAAPVAGDVESVGRVSDA